LHGIQFKFEDLQEILKHNQGILFREHPEYQDGVSGCPKALTFVPLPPQDPKPTPEMYAEWEMMATARDQNQHAGGKQMGGHPEVYDGVPQPQAPYGNGYDLPPEYYGYPPGTFDEYGQWTHGYTPQPPQDPAHPYSYDSYGNYYQPYPAEGQFPGAIQGQPDPDGTHPNPAAPPHPNPAALSLTPSTQNGGQEAPKTVPEDQAEAKKLSKAEQLKLLLEKRKQKTQPN
jgi:hypothetical protein